MTNAINCANTVAAAAPHVPVFHTATNKRSSTIFVKDAMARYSRERLELPTAFKIPLAIL